MSRMCAGQITLDQWGYVVATEDCKTDVPGVFLARDIRTKPIRQFVSAASDSTVAGIMAERYIMEHK